MTLVGTVSGVYLGRIQIGERSENSDYTAVYYFLKVWLKKEEGDENCVSFSFLVMLNA